MILLLGLEAADERGAIEDAVALLDDIKRAQLTRRGRFAGEAKPQFRQRYAKVKAGRDGGSRRHFSLGPSTLRIIGPSRSGPTRAATATISRVNRCIQRPTCQPRPRRCLPARSVPIAAAASTADRRHLNISTQATASAP